MDTNYKLYQGDCLEAMDKLIEKGIKFDAIIADPPYGTTACKWDSVIPFDAMWERLNKLIKDNGAIVLFGSQPFTSELVHSNINNYKHYWIWDKEICGAFALAKKRPMIVTEEILVFSKNNNRINYYPIMEDAIPKNIRPVNLGSSVSEATPVSSGIAKSDKNYNPKKRYPKNIIKYSKYNKECNQLNRVHPTQKPVEILEYLIKTYTNEGDLVLDFTMGSGSTGVACLNTNRKFIGIELNEKYFNIAKNRMEELDKNN
nr:MAG TPA: adenine-specific methyltransferase [Caudoviricetes sp.]